MNARRERPHRGGIAWSWRKPLPPEVHRVSLESRASAEQPFAADLSEGTCEFNTHAFFPQPADLRVVTLRLRPSHSRVTTFKFAAGAESEVRFAGSADEDSRAWRPAPAVRKVAAKDEAPPDVAQSSRTRISPPADAITLQDRLYYVLQPPLESWIARDALVMPFQPFPYQLQGVAFLYPRTAAILADEMGLGKTMQAITTVRLLLHRGELCRVLLVCPKPLVTNWQREFGVWAPEIPLVTVEGPRSRREWLWQHADAPVMIANYELLVHDSELLGGTELEFDLVILDEAQRIKNRASSTAKAARAIERRRSWALTGTPIENSVEDLIGIFEYIAPGHLASEIRPRRLARLTGDYILRRTKEQVLVDLPPKLYRDAQVDLTDAQRRSYHLAESEGTIQLAGMQDTLTIGHVFELVLRLKQICNFDPPTGESAKFDRLEADLEEVAASGQKALIFSQWVGTLVALDSRLRRFGPLQLHGKIPSRRRDQVIERFRQDPSSHVLLISYGAGGVGLNLQFASYVFLFDRWWNPAVEDQAINRAHRIGVEHPVTVTRFIAQGTIEERIDQILSDKRELLGMLFPGEALAHESGLSREDIFSLFDLQGPAAPAAAA